jgi:hypothetical protein
MSGSGNALHNGDPGVIGGNVYSIIDGVIYKNGTSVRGGSGSSAVAIVEVLWGQDASTGKWFTFDGTNWNPQSGPPVPLIFAGVPGAPTGLQVTNPTPTSLTVSFAPPTAGGSILGGGYQIGFRRAASGNALHNGDPGPRPTVLHRHGDCGVEHAARQAANRREPAVSPATGRRDVIHFP